MRELMDDALELMEVKFTAGQKAKVVIRAAAKKKRSAHNTGASRRKSR